MGSSTEPIKSARGHEDSCPIEGPEKTAILHELDSVLNSTFFRGSERSKQFLSYVVHHRLKGNHERLKERTIGADLFERPAGYSTGDDPIVRVQAGEVRRRLGQYYQADGNRSPVHIELHTGSYSPEFTWTQAVEQHSESTLSAPQSELPPQAEAHPELPLPTAVAPETSTIQKLEKYRRLLWTSPILGLALALAYILTGPHLPTVPPSALKQFWSPVFNTSGPVLICLANPPTYRPSPGLYRRYAKNPSAYSTEFERLFGAGTGVWSFAPQVTVPIFTGGENRADLDSAKAGSRIAVADYEKAIQTAFREVADALVANDSYARQVEVEIVYINAEQRRYDLASLRYRQGEDTYLNVLSAQQDLYSAQQGRLDAQYNKLASQISLYQALGGGWK